MFHYNLIIKNHLKSFSVFRVLRSIYQRRGFTKRNAELAFDQYYCNESNLVKNSIIKDMLIEAIVFGFSFNEYHMYHFETLPFGVRRTYVSDIERIRYCERMNEYKNMIIFDDKGKTFERFKRYYHRDLLSFGSHININELNSFVVKHKKFIAKPYDGACGVGIKIINSKDYSLKELANYLNSMYPQGFVVEELIIQDGRMAALHPQSVNTLRIPTINYGTHVDIIHPIFRVGTGSSIVDNGGSGGICCGIDLTNGITFSASDENGKEYSIHPDTGIALVGFQIPRWDEAKELVHKLAQEIPDNHYTGWDLALTEDGWILQEANDRGTFILFQITQKKGFKPEIERIVEELGV